MYVEDYLLDFYVSYFHFNLSITNYNMVGRMSEKSKHFVKNLKKWKKEIIVFSGIGILVIGGFLGAFYSFYGPLINLISPPIISSYSPEINPILTQEESYEFGVIASDPKGYSLTYTWYLNDVNQGVLSNFYTYSYGQIEPGIHSVKVEVSNGRKTTCQEWNLTILELQLFGDFNDNTEDSDIEELYCADGTLYFSADDQNTGRNYGCTTLKGYGWSRIFFLVNQVPVLLISAILMIQYILLPLMVKSSRLLYRTDGTAEGTQIVNDTIGAVQSSSRTVNVLEDVVYFSGYNSTVGNELFGYNHSSEEMYLIEDINPNAASSTPYQLTPLKDELYFIAYDDVFGREVFKTDGN